MKKDIEVSIETIDFSKKLSVCSSGEIVSAKNKRYLLVNLPELCEKEQNIFQESFKELKQSTKKIF